METKKQLVERLENNILEMASKGTLELDLKWYLEHAINQAFEMGKINILEEQLDKEKKHALLI